MCLALCYMAVYVSSSGKWCNLGFMNKEVEAQTYELACLGHPAAQPCLL